MIEEEKEEGVSNGINRSLKIKIEDSRREKEGLELLQRPQLVKKGPIAELFSIAKVREEPPQVEQVSEAAEETMKD